MKTFFLDSNIYDEFLKSSELFGLVLLAKREGIAKFIGTHLEPDELIKTLSSNPEKGFLLMSYYRELDIQRVITEGHVLDVSRLDESKLFENRDAKTFLSLTADNPDHAEDVLMIITAKREGAAFVTQEKRIPRLCREIGIECITAQELGEWCYLELPTR